MERIESAASQLSTRVEPLSCQEAAEPIACCWAVAAAGLAGAAIGAGVGWVQCHYHGCVHQAEDVPAAGAMAGMSVGDLLSVRHDAAASR